MLIPTKIVYRYEERPYATWALVGLNVAIFLLMWGEGESALLPWALNTEAFNPVHILTSMFLHGGVTHLLGNMLFLYVYGRYVEERMGPWRFLAVYVACEIGADLAFVAFSRGASVGASGAVSGLMGFVLVGAPWVQMRMLLLWLPYVRRFEMVALWTVGLWLLAQFFDAALSAGLGGGVAYSAHFGGCATGAALALTCRNLVPRDSPWWLDGTPPGAGPARSARLRAARHGGAMEKPVASEPAIRVTLSAVSEAPSKVALIKVLMVEQNLDAEVANAELLAVAAGTPKDYVCRDTPSAEQLAEALRRAGASATVHLPLSADPIA